MPDIIVIAGPTASGKSDIALALALKLNGEIVNADSRQIYKFTARGTAQPTPQDLKTVPHHLYDFLDPKQFYSAGDFVRDAVPAIQSILDRGRVPILSGGTGLYMRALFDGLAAMPKRDDHVRMELQEIAVRRGKQTLHKMLVDIDPVAAQNIPWQNIQRVVRAIEVHKLTGQPISELQAKTAPPRPNWRPMYFGIEWNKDVLKERIRARTQNIIPGIVDETRELLDKGYGPTDPGFQGIGYRQAAEHLQGKLSKEALFEAVLKGTLAYAKRQSTWFRKEPRMAWIPAQEPFNAKTLADRIAALHSSR